MRLTGVGTTGAVVVYVNSSADETTSGAGVQPAVVRRLQQHTTRARREEHERAVREVLAAYALDTEAIYAYVVRSLAPTADMRREGRRPLRPRLPRVPPPLRCGAARQPHWR